MASLRKPRPDVPVWVNYGLIPGVNLGVALVVSGFIALAIGADPIAALQSLVYGAIGYPEAVGYTLFYATNFIFTGLAVAVAFHCGLFNIGGEGQAYIGGLGAGLLCLALGDFPWWLALPLVTLAAAIFGGAWAYIPAYLQAKRGSHIVITTIMFNFIAATLMTYLLVNVLIAPGQQNPQSAEFAPAMHPPFIHDIFASLGIEVGRSPLNITVFVALLCCFLVWLFLWKSRWGYAIRAVGHSETAASYAGIRPDKFIIIAMLASGALAGLVGLNEVVGVHHRIILGFPGGAGFVGIAVALMGRNHPVGIIVAALLFGALYQGGSEIAFDIPTFTREMIVAVQGLVILFCGALENMFRPQIENFFRRKRIAVAAGA